MKLGLVNTPTEMTIYKLNASGQILEILYGPRCKKPCLEQWCRPACASANALYAFWKVSFLNLLQANFHCSSLSL